MRTKATMNASDDIMTTLPAELPKPKLFRVPTEGKVSGVCYGIAHFTGLPVIFVRLIALLLAFTGVGIVLYFLAWLLMKVDPSEKGLALPGKVIFTNLMVVASPAIVLPTMYELGFGEKGAIFSWLGVVAGLIFLQISRRSGVSMRMREGGIRSDRDEDDRILIEEELPRIGGVFAFLGRRSGIRPAILRMIAVILFFPTFPFLPIFYGVAAAVIPRRRRLQTGLY